MATRVLIVDDALFMRTMLRNIFVESGFEVVGEAGSGVEAVERYRQLSPDLTTMDIVMPERNGIEALKKMLSPTITVLRGGREEGVPSKDLVPGDVMLLEAGDKIPADGRVGEGHALRCDEASLTGSPASYLSSSGRGAGPPPMP